MATITSPRATSPSATPRITSPSIASLNSPVGTPTSSLRPSFDLPRDTTGNETTANPKRRNRAALRDYYNLKSRPGALSQRSASTASNISDSTVTSSTTVADNQNDSSPPLAQLDGPTFSPQSFITNILATASLRDLLRTESALVSEIRTLDGERKSLVYDNYSKLITAVGTIGEMQKGMVKGLGGGATSGADGMQGLREKFEGLEVLVKEMAPEGATEGIQAEQEEEKRRQQNMVREILGTPKRLRELDTEQAEQEWEIVRPILDAWKEKGIQGTEEVMKTCEDIMKEKLEDAHSPDQMLETEVGNEVENKITANSAD